MTCQECELALAGEQSNNEVTAHLAACESCKLFAADLQANQQAFRKLAAEPLPRLKPAVRKLPRGWAWMGAAAAVAAAIVILMAIPALHKQSPAGGTAVAVRAGSPARPMALAAAKPLIARVSAKKARRAIRPSEPKILQVKMLTDDPNVVIYWQVETHPTQNWKGTE